MAAGGARFDAALAPCLVLGYADISSSGVRSVMLLRELLKKEVSEARRRGSTGTLWYRDENGVPRDCAIAWAGIDPLANLYIETFHDEDGKPVLSLICLNAQIVEGSTSSVALSLVQKIIQDRVEKVYLLCGLRFNPKSDNLEDKVHICSLGADTKPNQHFPEFDQSTRLNDSFLSAFAHLIKLEGEIATTLCIIPAHRLPTSLCLNLPPCEPDSSKHTYINLILATGDLELGSIVQPKEVGSHISDKFANKDRVRRSLCSSICDELSLGLEHPHAVPPSSSPFNARTTSAVDVLACSIMPGSLEFPRKSKYVRLGMLKICRGTL
eukprot:748008-Hanusia_phi.AAC.1